MSRSKLNIYLEVVPFANIPIKHAQKFTYSAKKEMNAKVGQIAEIDFHGKRANGVIVNILPEMQDPKMVIKSIHSIRFPAALFDADQIGLIEAAGKYYYCSLGLWYKNIPLKIPKKIKDDFSSIKPSKEAKRPNKNFLLSMPESERLMHYFELIKKTLPDGRQIIFVFPELAAVYRFTDIFCEKYGKEKIAVFHGHVNPKKYFENWRACQSGQAKIIIGSRQAVWAPAPRLDALIIEQEGNPSHKQWDMHPRYDARVIARLRSKIQKCRLYYGSAAPSLSTLYDFAMNKYRIERSAPAKPDIMILDLKREPKKAGTPLTHILEDELKKNHQAGRQSLLVANRRGQSGMIVCSDCGYIPKCPDCGITLMELKPGLLACLHCSHKENAPQYCPECRSVKLDPRGYGLEKAGQIVQKLIPEANVAIYDQDQARSKKNLLQIFQEFDTNKTDILIGTVPVLNFKTFNLGLIAFMDLDQFFADPEYDSKEKLYSLISETVSSEYKLILQVRNADDPMLKYIRNGLYNNFAADELSLRKNFSYPPYAKIIKLSYKNNDLSKLKDAQRDIGLLLQKVKKADGLRVFDDRVLGLKKIRGAYIAALVLNIPISKWEDDSCRKDIDGLLASISGKWTIDVDPERIF